MQKRFRLKEKFKNLYIVLVTRDVTVNEWWLMSPHIYGSTYILILRYQQKNLHICAISCVCHVVVTVVKC